MTNIKNIKSNASVLRQLRALMPSRVLTLHEALQRAELQAGRLLELCGVTAAPVPIDVITEAPRIRVVYDWDIPTSGSAHWDGTDWVITLNAGETRPRQHFSLCHEYKHIVDHPTRHLMKSARGLRADEVAERVADYFAASLLMPKAWVKTAYFTGTQSIPRLAARFQVSPQAMSVRLRQLGLTEPVQRCHRRRKAVESAFGGQALHFKPPLTGARA